MTLSFPQRRGVAPRPTRQRLRSRANQIGAHAPPAKAQAIAADANWPINGRPGTERTPELPGPRELKQLIPNAAAADIALKQAAVKVRPSRLRTERPGPSDGAPAMTPQQVELVRKSFAKVAPITDQAATLFYRRLFELDPALQPLFKGDMTAQGARLMTALGGVVAALDQLAGVLPAVRELGRRHAAYGARPEHYATVGEALIWTLERALGAEFTRDARRAWKDAYAHLAWTMIAAAEQDETLAQAA
jgi:nitric oxide dioxygenase